MRKKADVMIEKSIFFLRQRLFYLEFTILLVLLCYCYASFSPQKVHYAGYYVSLLLGLSLLSVIRFFVKRWSDSTNVLFVSFSSLFLLLSLVFSVISSSDQMCPLQSRYSYFFVLSQPGYILFYLFHCLSIVDICISVVRIFEKNELSGHKTLRYQTLFMGIIWSCIYLALSGFFISNTQVTGDEPHILLNATSLINDGDLNLLNNYEQQDYAHFYAGELLPQPADKVRTAEIRSYHSPVMTLLMVPGMFVAGRIGAVLTMVFIGSLLMSLLQRWLLLFFTPRDVVPLVFICGMSVPFSAYVFRIFPEVPAALCIVVILHIIASKKILSLKDIIQTGIVCLFLVMLKVRFAPLAVVFSGYCFYAFFHHRQKRMVLLIGSIAVFAAGAFIFIVSVVDAPLFLSRYFHIIRDYAKIMTRWDHSSVSAFFGLFFDQEYGLFFYGPLFVVGLFGYFIHPGEKIPRRIRVLLVVAISVYYFSLVKHKSLTWHGGWAPPIRFLCVTIPLYLPFLASFLSKMQKWKRPLVFVLVAYAWFLSYLFFFQPFLAFNDLDGSAKWMSYVAHMTTVPIPSYFPSFVRPNTAIVFWIISLFLMWGIWYSISVFFSRSHEPWQDELCSSGKLNLCTISRADTGKIIIIFFAIALTFFALHWAPTWNLEAEDRLDFRKSSGRFFPAEDAAENERVPLFRNGWEMTTNGRLIGQFRTIFYYYRVQIWAKGTAVNKVWPHLTVSIDDKQTFETSIRTEEIVPFPHEYKKIARQINDELSIRAVRWQSFEFKVRLNPGIHTIALEFTNDERNIDTGEDRNLIIDRVTFIPAPFPRFKDSFELSLFPHFLYGNIR